MCKIGVSRGILWAVWTAATVLGAVYFVLSLETFYKVYSSYEDADDADKGTVAVLVASFGAAVVLLLFTVVSLLVLLGKQMFRSAVGYYYGFVNASAINTAILSLLCGLVLSAFVDDIDTRFDKSAQGGYDWDSTDTDVYKTTYAFAFIAAAGYVVLFIIMFFTSFTIDRENSLVAEENV